MAGLYTHTSPGTTLSLTEYDANHQNHIDNHTMEKIEGYSADTTEMRAQTDPGESGSESLANSGAGELERLRYTIAEMKGKDYWYETDTKKTVIATRTTASNFAANAVLTLETADYDPESLVNTGSGTITVDRDGIYYVSTFVRTGQSLGGTYTGYALQVNGSAVFEETEYDASGNLADIYLSGSTLLNLSSGDVVRLIARYDSGSAIQYKIVRLCMTMVLPT